MSEQSGELNLVCKDDILAEFEDLGISLDGDKVIDELVKLSLEYNLTPADLYAHWLSYNAKNYCDKLDLVAVSDLRSRIHQEKIKAAQHEIKAKFVPRAKPKLDTERDILETYVSLSNIKKEPIFELKKSKQVDDDGEAKPIGPVIKQEPRDEPVDESMEEYQDDITFETVKKSAEEVFPATFVKVERSEKSEFTESEFIVDDDDHLYEKEVVCEYGRAIPAKSWLTIKSDRKISLLPFDPSNHLSNDLKFMESSIYKNIKAMDDIHDSLRNLYLTAVEDTIGEFDYPVDGDCSYFGKIRIEAVDQFDEKSIFLHSDSSAKKRYQLDLSNAKEYSLFPGQYIEVKGRVNQNTIHVNEVVDPGYLIRPFPSQSLSFGHPLNIVTASGPFNSSASIELTPLDNLLDYVVSFRPDIVLLFGPIVEMTSSLFSYDSEEIFTQAMEKISEKISGSGTRVIVISSSKEWHHLPVFPTPPYQSGDGGSWNGIEFHPSPSILDISGLVIGVSSEDVILHLTKSLVESQESGNRIKRILRHILVQQSFYPLYPPNDSVNLEIPKLKYCRFAQTPHIMILPSMLRNFIWSVDNCLFINPEKVRKNFISRIQVFPNQEKNFSNGLDKSSVCVQIIKV